MFPSKVLGRGEGEEKADGRESHTVPKMYSLGRGRAQCPGGKHSACVYCARAFFFFSPSGTFGSTLAMTQCKAS